MSVRCTSLAAAVALGLAALTLTACGQDDATTPTAASAPVHTTGTPAGGGTQTGPTAVGTGPTSSHQPSQSAEPSSAPTGIGTNPTPGCAAQAEANEGPVIHLTAAAATGNVLTAQKAGFVCGPDVPDDGYWQGSGVTAQYAFAASATFELFDGSKPVNVSKQVFLQVASRCLTNPSAVLQPHHCYGNLYAVTLGTGNTITSISELFHP